MQNVAEECAFVRRIFKEVRGREPLVWREDFCGTASASCEWVRTGEDYRATGVDIDQDVLDWGREHRLNQLSLEQKARLSLIKADVMEAEVELVDIVGAFNFSYWIFQKRADMLKYFRHVRDGLKDDGIFFLDAFGGSEAFEEMKEKTKHDEFTYVWDQHSYSPVTGEMVCHIHFKFPDKSKMKKAFTYTWRLWTLPEIQEMLAEAGFANTTIYWEGTDDDGEGDGVFTPEERGEADAGWIAYIVAEK
ncbi:MAG: class I SAM-dependent methyltransferase [Gammaproteobacteria bacterium]